MSGAGWSRPAFGLTVTLIGILVTSGMAYHPASSNSEGDENSTGTGDGPRHSGITLSAWAPSSPVVDGRLDSVSGEWDAADFVDLDINVPEGGTVPGRLYVMNDGSNIYLAIRYERAAPDTEQVAHFEFDNDHDGLFLEQGDDDLLFRQYPGVLFQDGYRTLLPPCPSGDNCGFDDTVGGGTEDGGGAFDNNGSHSAFEFSHPLDTTDDAHDFSLHAGATIGFISSLNIVDNNSFANSDLEGDIRIAPYCVIQGATSYEVSTVKESKSVISYYDYYSVSAHTPLVEAYVSVLFLYTDLTSGNTYLVFHFNIDNGGTPDAETEVAITGIPPGASVVLSDDPGEFSLSGTPQGQFHYFSNTDGGVLGPLPTSPWKMNLTLTHFGVDPIQSQRWIDGDGTALALSMSGVIRVSNICNESPTASPGGPYVGAEASAITFDAGGSTDPDGDPLTYRWDYDGDGTWDTSSSSDPTATHTFGDDWAGQAQVEVSDGELTDVATVSVTVANVAPVIDSTSIPTGDEGQALLFQARITDPGSDDLVVTWSGACAGWSSPTTYANDPANFPDPDPSPDVHARDVMDVQTVVCGDDGTYVWNVNAKDDDGGDATSSGTFFASNLAPFFVMPPSMFVSVDEGTVWPIFASAQDAGSDDLTFTWTWELGPTETVAFYNAGVTPDPDNSPWGTFPFFAVDSSLHVYGDDGTYIVTLRVEDDDGGAIEAMTTFSIANHRPAYTLTFCPQIVGCDPRRDEGELSDYWVLASDLGSDDLGFTWAWGDGSPEENATYFNDGLGPDPLPSPGGTFPFDSGDARPHVYADDGGYVIHVDTKDDDDGTSSIDATVEIVNVPPTVTALDAHGDEAATISFAAAFTDPGFDFAPAGTREDFTAIVDWGDGSSESIAVTEVPGRPGVPTTGSLAAPHVYGDNGAFPVTVTVCDDDGGCGSASTTITVFNVAPSPSIDDVSQKKDRHLPAAQFYPLDPIRFNGSAADPGSDDLSFAWDFGDGTVLAGGTYYNDGVGPDPFPSPGGTFPFAAKDAATHAYRLPSDYLVTLTATDDDDGTAHATFTVHVASPQELKSEAASRIRELKRTALDRQDWRFVNNLDDAERFVLQSLGFVDPFHPKTIDAEPGSDVAVARNTGDRVDLVLGPSWTAGLGSRVSLLMTWENGVVTTVDLPDRWPKKALRFDDEVWVDAWRQDFQIDSKRDKATGQVTLKVHVHDASLGVSLSLDGDVVADFSFTYGDRPFWIDDAHLDSRIGADVFVCERAAVDHLVRLEISDDDDDDGDDGGDHDGDSGGAGVLSGDGDGDDGDDDDHDSRDDDDGNHETGEKDDREGCGCGDGDDDGDCGRDGGDGRDGERDGDRENGGILGGEGHDDDDDDDDDWDDGDDGRECACGDDEDEDDDEDGHDHDGRDDDDEVSPEIRAIHCRLTERLWTAEERATLNAECDVIANLLVKADEVLARIILEDAKGTPVRDPNDQARFDRAIARSERSLGKANEAWGLLEYGDAICDFLRSWEDAQRAIEIAVG